MYIALLFYVLYFDCYLAQIFEMKGLSKFNYDCKCLKYCYLCLISYVSWSGELKVFFICYLFIKGMYDLWLMNKFYSCILFLLYFYPTSNIVLKTTTQLFKFLNLFLICSFEVIPQLRKL